MKTFEFEVATSVSDAVHRADRSAGTYLAGGTNLVDLMKNGVSSPDTLVDIRRLGLSDISATDAGGVYIGAGATNSAVANHALIRTRYPVLSQAILSGATTQLRNMASVGGNLMQRTRCPYFMQPEFAHCNKRVPGSGCAARGGFHREHAVFGASEQCVAVNPSDMAVALAMLDAVVHVHGTHGARTVPIAEFFAPPGDTPQVDNTLAPADLIVGVELPPSGFADASWYLKVRDRHSYAFALVSVAAGLDVRGGLIQAAGLVLGGVASRPWRLDAAAAALIGLEAGPAAFEIAADMAMDGAQPLPHNAFKVDLGRHAVLRALTLAVRDQPPPS